MRFNGKNNNRNTQAVIENLETRKLMSAVNVTDFGAKPNDGIDDTKAIQNAINASRDGDTIVFGNQVIRVIPTPGHTPGCVTYHWRDRLFTGDSLLIGGCGRTDFQGGSASKLYDSITERLFVMPDETLVYPGHDYHGARVSCIGQEKNTNLRLAGRSRQEFIELMGNLSLPRPTMMDDALPANLRCGKSLSTDAHGA